MRLGFAISLFLHAALLAWALVSVGETRPLKLPEPEPIVAEIISEADLTQIRQGRETAKLEEAKANDSRQQKEPLKESPKPTPPPPPAPSNAADPPPPPEEVKPPTPEKVAEPPPTPKEAPDQLAMLEKLDEVALQQAAEKKRQEEAAKAKAADEAKKAEELKKAQEKKKSDEKKKRELAEAKKKKDEAEKKRKDAEAKAAKSTADRISALLDKTPNPKEAAAAAPATPTPATKVGPVKGAADGRDAANAAREGAVLLGIIVSKVKTCWNIQAGGSEASAQVPKIRFDLNRDGSLRSEPRIMNQQSSPQFNLAADAAKRAVVDCQKYDLPGDKYDLWKTVTLDFDPREMFQ